MFDELLDSDPPAAGAAHLAEVAARARRHRRRRQALVTGSAVVVAVAGTIVVAVVSSWRAPDASPPPPAVTPGGTGPLPTTMPTSPPTTMLAVVPPSGASTLGVPESTTAPTAEAVDLESLIQEIDASAAQIDSFRVLAEVTSWSGDQEPSRRLSRVTLRADRAMWADLLQWPDGATDGHFASYDPTTGISRALFPGVDGVAMAQEIVGWNENSTGEQILLGHAPVASLTGMVGKVDVADDVHDGRPVWRVTLSVGDPAFADPGAAFQTTRWIERSTGLTLRERNVTFAPIEPGGELVESVVDSSWTELELGVDLPEAFPGELPEGVTVDRSGDADNFVGSAVPSALARALGRDVWLPALGDRQMLIQAEIHWAQYDADGQPVREPGSASDFTVVLAEGFSTARIHVSTDPAMAPPPPGPDAPTVAVGHLAGAPYSADAGTVTVLVDDEAGPLVVTVSAATLERAVAIVERLGPV